MICLWRWRALMAVSGVLVAVAAQAQDRVWVKPPAETTVLWRGMLPTEGAGVGAGGFMLYPAAGVLGLLAAIATHAAINQGAQNAKRLAEQQAADKVLEPYRALLQTLTPQQLWDQMLASAPATGVIQLGTADTPERPLAEVTPVFTLTPDEEVVILDAAVQLTRSAAPLPQPVLLHLRVLSTPLKTGDARSHWTADEGLKIKAVAAAMLAHALTLALKHSGPSSTEQVQRTHRYLQGTTAQTERAEQLGGDCARAVLRTLRGGLMSVPLAPAEGCDKATDHGF